MSSAVGDPPCFMKYKVGVIIYQKILDNFMLPSADELPGDADELKAPINHRR